MFCQVGELDGLCFAKSENFMTAYVLAKSEDLTAYVLAKSEDLTAYVLAKSEDLTAYVLGPSRRT